MTEKKKLIKGTHHTAIMCKNVETFEKTIAFYTEILGLEIVRAWGKGDDAGIMISTGDCLIEIFATGQVGNVPGPVDHLALATDDVDACIAAVREAGYEVTREPSDIEIPAAEPFPARIAFCIGAAGEKIEFFNEK